MDYSLLLGEIVQTKDQVMEVCAQDPVKGRGIYLDDQDRVWQIAIIDPLNIYDIEKKLEYMAKAPRFGHAMSCVPPDAYKTRFMGFMEGNFNQLETSYQSQ